MKEVFKRSTLAATARDATTKVSNNETRFISFFKKNYVEVFGLIDVAQLDFFAMRSCSVLMHVTQNERESKNSIRRKEEEISQILNIVIKIFHTEVCACPPWADEEDKYLKISEQINLKKGDFLMKTKVKFKKGDFRKFYKRAREKLKNQGRI